MKKNAMLKIAAILMVAVLLTTCAISSTFAKYASSANDSTSARVAKWGVTVNSDIFSTSPLFAKEYGTANANAEAKHVKADNIVVAPGTNNSISVDSIIDGTPEVSGEVIITATIKLGDGWVDADGNFYCPLQFNVNDEDFEFTSKTDKTFTDTIYFDAGVALDSKVAVFNVDWEWDLEADADNSVDDVKDTFLAGTNADGTLRENYSAPTISVELDIKVQQTGAAGTPAAVAP